LFFASAVVVEVIAYFIIDSFVAGGCVNVMCFIGVDALIVDDDGLFFGFERWRREGWLRLFRGGWRIVVGGGGCDGLHGLKTRDGGAGSQPDVPLLRSSGEA
jgi:hypothetical protein